MLSQPYRTSQGIHNTTESISSFARACFGYAIDTKQDLWFATKDTFFEIVLFHSSSIWRNRCTLDCHAIFFGRFRARHAYGDVYKNTEIKVPGKGKAELVFTAEDGTETRELIHNFAGAGIIQGIHNTTESISSFARACFGYAIASQIVLCILCHKLPEKYL